MFSEALATAALLEAELVEQVGELSDHWLIRAPYSARLTRRSDVLESDMGEIPPRTGVELDVDHVMENYNSLRSGSTRQYGLGYNEDPASPFEVSGRKRNDIHSRLDTRSSSSFLRSNIISLERQVLKKRVKRQLSLNILEGRRAQMNTPKKQSTVSQYLRDLALQLGIQDPLWAKQWHLANDVMKENSINVTDVWSQGVTGKGIKVAIVDDGLDSELVLPCS